MDRNAVIAYRASSAAPGNRRKLPGSASKLNRGRQPGQRMTVSTEGAGPQFHATCDDDLIRCAVDNLNSISRGEQSELPSLQFDVRGRGSPDVISPRALRTASPSIAVTMSPGTMSLRPSPYNAEPQPARAVAPPLSLDRRSRVPSSAPPVRSFPEQFRRDLEQGRKITVGGVAEPLSEHWPAETLEPMAEGGVVERSGGPTSLTPGVHEMVRDELFGPHERLKRLHDREHRSLAWVSYWASVDEMREANDSLLGNVQDRERALEALLAERERLREALRSSVRNVAEMQGLVETERLHGQEMVRVEKAKLDDIRGEADRVSARADELRKQLNAAEGSAQRANHEAEMAVRDASKAKQALDESNMQHAVDMVKLRREVADKLQRAEQQLERLETLEAENTRQSTRIKALDEKVALLTDERNSLNDKLQAARTRNAGESFRRAASGADATQLQQMTEKAFLRREADLVAEREAAVSRSNYLSESTRKLRTAVRQRLEAMESDVMLGLDIDAVSGVRYVVPAQHPKSLAASRRGKAAAVYTCGPLHQVQVEGRQRVEDRLASKTEARQFAGIVESYQQLVFSLLPDVVERFNVVVDVSWGELSSRIPAHPTASPKGTRETLHSFFQDRANALQRLLGEIVTLHSDAVASIGAKEAAVTSEATHAARADAKSVTERSTVREARSQQLLAEAETAAADASHRKHELEQLIAELYGHASSAIESVVTGCGLPALLDVDIDEAAVLRHFSAAPSPELAATAVLLAKLSAAASDGAPGFAGSFGASTLPASPKVASTPEAVRLRSRSNGPASLSSSLVMASVAGQPIGASRASGQDAGSSSFNNPAVAGRVSPARSVLSATSAGDAAPSQFSPPRSFNDQAEPLAAPTVHDESARLAQAQSRIADLEAALASQVGNSSERRHSKGDAGGSKRSGSVSSVDRHSEVQALTRPHSGVSSNGRPSTGASAGKRRKSNAVPAWMSNGLSGLDEMRTVLHSSSNNTAPQLDDAPGRHRGTSLAGVDTGAGGGLVPVAGSVDSRHGRQSDQPVRQEVTQVRTQRTASVNSNSRSGGPPAVPAGVRVSEPIPPSPVIQPTGAVPVGPRGVRGLGRRRSQRSDDAAFVITNTRH